jgi:REP element-mobilizing transposase RayT
MPRRVRIEYPGAVYHVLNRGNYRRDIFSAEGSKKSFEQTLFQACHKYDWALHAYCLLKNHYTWP